MTDFPDLWCVPFAARGAIVADAADETRHHFISLKAPRNATEGRQLVDLIEHITLILLAAYRRALNQTPGGVTVAARVWRATSHLEVALAPFEALDTKALRKLTADALFGTDGEIGATARVQARFRLAELTRDDGSYPVVRTWAGRGA